MTTRRRRRFKAAAYSSLESAYRGKLDRGSSLQKPGALGPTAGRGWRRVTSPRRRNQRSRSAPGRRLLLRLWWRRLWCAGNQRKGEHGDRKQFRSPRFDLAHENASSPPSDDDQAARLPFKIATLRSECAPVSEILRSAKSLPCNDDRSSSQHGRDAHPSWRVAKLWSPNRAT